MIAASGCGLVGKARALGARDRGFESRHPDHLLYDATGTDAEPKIAQAGLIDIGPAGHTGGHVISRWL